MDQMVLKTQQWLDNTYRGRTGYVEVNETGNTGWATISALMRAMQIEFGITSTSSNFGPTTKRLVPVIPYTGSTYTVEDIEKATIDGKTFKYGKDMLKQEDMLLSTGATERNKSNNIYDLAGNLAELTISEINDRGGFVKGRLL